MHVNCYGHFMYCDEYVYFGEIMRSHDISHQCEWIQLLHFTRSFSSTDYTKSGEIKLFRPGGILHKIIDGE